MPPEVLTEVDAQRRALAAAAPGIARHAPYRRLLEAQRHCTELVHGWLADALGLERVVEPRLVLSLDVDGVLEDESAGFSATSLTGAAALKLLQLGRICVLLNTARSLEAVQDRVDQLRLLGGVAEFGAATWDGVFGRERSLVSKRGADQLSLLRTALLAEHDAIQDASHQRGLRASRLVDGHVAPIPGPDARQLIDRHGLHDLTFWVAPRYTDFVDRSVDKSTGLSRLISDLRLTDLPVAAMGDASCDVPMLRQARFAFLPAATLPSYQPPRRQHLYRSRHLGDQALWDAACHLVPSVALQRRVLTITHSLNIPEWIPASLRQPPANGRGFLPRLAAAFAVINR